MVAKEQYIPEGWSVKKLKHCCLFMGGSTPLREKNEYFGGNIFWVKTTDLNNSILTDTEEKLTQLGLDNSSCKVVPSGSVCVAMYGGFNQIGRTGLLKINAAINQALTAIIPNNTLNNKFLLLYLNQNINLWKKYAGSSRKDPNITKKDVEQFPIFLPPLPEQEKIVEILGVWDDGIEKLSKLVEEKKKLKKGMMQRLLTGKQRLKGFTEPWKEVQLGNIAKIRKGEQLNKLNMISYGFPVFNGGTILSGYTNNYNTQAHTIIISEGGNSCGFINYITENFWAGGHCYVLKEISTQREFLYNFLKFNEYFIMKLRVGSGLPNIQKEAIEKFKLFIPISLTEQKAIADILSKQDEGIDLLTKKLEMLKQQKKGLMQQLLTGKTRVKVN